MKSSSNIRIALGISCWVVTVQAGWGPLNSPTTRHLYGVHFPIASTGFAVGDSGTILKTTDGGNNWTPKTSGTLRSLASVYFVSINEGYAVGSEGVILYTGNGGENWIPRTSTTTADLNSICMPTSGIIFVAGSGGLIVKGTNGGLLWTPDTVSPGINMRSVSFPPSNPNIGYAVGPGAVLKTTDQGFNWMPQAVDSNGFFFSAHFLSANTGYLGGNRVYNTGNGGASWYNVTPGVNFLAWSIFAADGITAYAVGEIGKIYRTEDNGSSWTPETSGTVEDLYSVFFTDAGTGYAVGYNGVILKRTQAVSVFISKPAMNRAEPGLFRFGSGGVSLFGDSRIVDVRGKKLLRPRRD